MHALLQQPVGGVGEPDVGSELGDAVAPRRGVDGGDPAREGPAGRFDGRFAAQGDGVQFVLPQGDDDGDFLAAADDHHLLAGLHVHYEVRKEGAAVDPWRYLVVY